MFKHLLSRRGLSLDRLAAILDLAAAGSLAKAADGDPNRQSLYSRQIKELEDYFGVELTYRRGHKLELTDAGRRLVAIGRETFAQLEDFQSECEARPSEVVIGAGDSVLQWLLLPRLGQLQRLYPDHTVRLQDMRTADLVAHLGEQRMDLGVIRESALVPPLTSKRLFKLPYSLFAPRDRLPQDTPPQWQTILKSIPLALQASGGQFHRTLEQAARTQRLRLEPALCCVSFTQASRAVLSGHYAAILPSIAAVDLPAERFVQLPLPLLKSYERVLCLAWNPRQFRLRPSLEKLTAYLGKSLLETVPKPDVSSAQSRPPMPHRSKSLR